MNKIFIIILLLYSSNLIAQRNKNIPPPPPSKNSSNKNINYKEITLEKRLNKFPFKDATKIEIISFNLESDRIDDLPKPILKDSIIDNKIEKVNISFISLEELIAQNDFERIIQRKSLTLNSISKLSDILYNTCSKYNVSNIIKLGCYNPRNGILFYNEFGEIYEYLEICFECKQIISKSKNIQDTEDFCTYVYSELNKFFIKNGIETSKRIKK
jgi:hypothetical protein